MIFFINADLHGEEPHSSDEKDTAAIGFFSTSEQALDAARNWVKEEREGGATDDICLWGWRGELDKPCLNRLCFLDDIEAKMMTAAFRDIEKEFPPEFDEK